MVFSLEKSLEFIANSISTCCSHGVKKLPDKEFIFLSLATKDPRSDSHDKSQSIPQIFKIVVVLSVITKASLDTPSASAAIHNVQLAIKDINLPDINILHLKNCTKIPHDIDILCCQPKIFH
jgi:hypothetical protein